MLKRILAAKRWLLAATVCLVVFPSLSGLSVDSAPLARTTPHTFTSAAAIVNLTPTVPAPHAATNSQSAAPAAPSARPVKLPADLKPNIKAVPVAAVFRSSITRVDEALKGQLLAKGIWNTNAPVPLDQLRVLQVSYWDFEGQVRTGRLVVNQAWSVQLSKVFKTLFDARFPLRQMDPLVGAATNGALAVVDNTRSFQARRVNGGWSMHAYGLAVDINPAENPWVRGGSVVPTAGKKFTDRSVKAPGVVRPNDVVVKAFKAIGWKWGGEWSSSKDYMHFSSNGH